ncbi:AzlC family ABC transporter permease [Pantoea sp. A4]|uniref:AzlC family ABC transporter permease n=1 Tax=Pantoea sp. A4 TaxID=1225184 RepID=UPI000368F2D5|nr:AzlC family ABC transporter permease [Pantoea sp. A4]
MSSELIAPRMPWRESFYDALPVVAGYFVVAFVFGMMCVNAGFPLWLPVAMCIFVYGGSSQFAALALLSSSGSFITIVLSTFLINARHILMAVYMAKKLDFMQLLPRQKALYAFGLTDESFALHSQRLASEKTTSYGYLVGFNTWCHLFWIAGGLVGAIASEYLAHLVDFKLDYALTAMMIFVLVSLCNSGQKLCVALSAVITTLLMNAWIPSSLNVFIATAVGCGVGLCLKRFS